MIPNVPAHAAWQALQADPAARLCDVRSAAEWEHVGVPAPDGTARPAVFVSWQVSPSMQHNPAFLDELAATGVSPNDHVYFICRSGARSQAAAEAARAAGFTHVYNVAEGFEGRPGVPGWAAQGLPARLPA